MRFINKLILIIFVIFSSCKNQSDKYINTSLLLSDWVETKNNEVLYFEDSLLFQTILPYSEKVVKYMISYDSLVIYSDDFEHFPIKPSNQIFKFKILQIDTNKLAILQVIPKITDTLIFIPLSIDSNKYSSFNQLELSHGICFGSCPAFDLKIDSDSMFYYNGYNSFVKHKGLFQHKLNSTEFKRIERKLNYIDRDSFKLEYPAPGSGSYSFFVNYLDDSIAVSGRYSKSERFNNYLLYLRYLDWILNIEPSDQKGINFRDKSNYDMFTKN